MPLDGCHCSKLHLLSSRRGLPSTAGSGEGKGFSRVELPSVEVESASADDRGF